MNDHNAERKNNKHICVYDRPNSPKGHRLREFISRHVAQFDWVEVHNDQECQKYLNVSSLKDVRLPVVALPEGKRLFDPSEQEVAEHLGWCTKPSFSEYDLAIYGGGPAGLSAAVYAACEGLHTILVERFTIGGQAGSSPLIENFIGFPNGVSGAEIAERARQQAVKFGVELCLQEGVKAEFKNNRVYGLLANGDKLSARANLCACGVDYRRLNLPNEDRFLYAGVFYGAGASEALFCEGEHVFIVGGGNGAGQSALHFARIASKVTMLVRGNNLSSTLSRYLIDRIHDNNKIEIMFNAQVIELGGDDWLRQIKVKNSHDNSIKTFNTGHLIVCIGGVPHTNYFKDSNVIRDEAGYIVTGPDLFKNGRLPESWPLERQPFYLESNIPGLFAAGDVRHNSVKRFASAVGEGSMAIDFIYRYLQEHP